MLVDGLELYASLSQRGVKGEVRFSGELGEEGGEEVVSVEVNLEVAEGSAGEYTWGIYEFPIDYTQVGTSSVLVATGTIVSDPDSEVFWIRILIWIQWLKKSQMLKNPNIILLFSDFYNILSFN